MNEEESMTVALSSSFLSSQLFSFTEAMVSTRRCSRTLQSGDVSPTYLQAKVSDAKSLISNTKNLAKIYTGVSQPLRLGM